MGLQETFYDWAKQYSAPEMISEDWPQVPDGNAKPKYPIETAPGGSVPPVDMPNPIPEDAPIGQGILNWFMWFIEMLQNMQGDFQNPQTINWTAMGYPPYVQHAWNTVNGVIGGRWNQNGLNSILAQWGQGGYGWGGNTPPDPDGGPVPA